LSRKLTRPVEGKISVGFGQMRDSVRNNGVLLSVNDNTPVYAISNGSVLFSGELPGFGQIIVIDHGDNYTSVYSGILSKVAKGTYVSAGSQIAISGNNSNQPMGGVYFELRHLGKPVNPTKLFN
jgi:septal ring factor EnvC (AmiA/AmiB activator)